MAIGSNQSGGVFADINITPLTDIFLVLLIIFMVATAITIESAAHVDLPKVQSEATTDKPKGVAVLLADMVRILDIAKTAGAQQVAIAVAKLQGGGGGGAEMGEPGLPSGPVVPPEPPSEGP